MSQVSACCHKEIIAGTRMDYPDGGSRYGIAYKIDVCDGCGKEVEEFAEQCGVCGVVECSEHFD